MNEFETNLASNQVNNVRRATTAGDSIRTCIDAEIQTITMGGITGDEIMNISDAIIKSISWGAGPTTLQRNEESAIDNRNVQNSVNTVGVDACQEVLRGRI